MAWIGGKDTSSGVNGYSYSWSSGGTATPDQAIDTATVDYNQSTIAAGEYITLGINEDGTVMAVGHFNSSDTSISSWTDIKAVAAGYDLALGLKNDGTVEGVGSFDTGGPIPQRYIERWTDIKAVASGRSHAVGLKENGTVVGIGDGIFEQTNVSSWTNIKAIAAGSFHTVGLKEDGTVIAVGRNHKGQTNVSSWTNIKAIAAGGVHTVGLKEDGTMVAVGYGGNGQMNISTWTDIEAISAGGAHTVGLKKDGTVMAVGYNSSGQTDVSSWRDIQAISAGDRHTVGLGGDSTIVAIGYNGSGETDVSSWTDIRQPTHLLSSATLTDDDWYFNLQTVDHNGNWSAPIHAGPYTINTVDPHTLIETSPTTPSLRGWFNEPTTANFIRGKPGVTYIQIDSNEDDGWTAADSTIAPEGAHTVNFFSVDLAGNTETIQKGMIRVDLDHPVNSDSFSSGSLHNAWSNKNQIEIGWIGATDSQSGVDGHSYSWSQNVTATPDLAIDTATIDKNYLTIADGGDHNVALKEDGTVIATGTPDFDYGQTNVSLWTDIKAIDAGFTHTVGLKEDGTVVAVGGNEQGQTNVSSWTDIEAIATGSGHTVGLKENGTVVAVGHNWAGQVNVSSWSDITAISAGYANTVGLKEDGTVVAVGGNWSGETNLSSWTDIKAVDAGDGFTVGLKRDGTVVAVGNNNYGQTNVSSWTGIKAIAAGGYHALGLKHDGTVVAVGYADYEQIDVTSWRNISAIDAGWATSLGLTNEGHVVAAGGSWSGQDDVSSWTDIRQPTYTASNLLPANGTWYFNLRTKDNADNWSPASHFGPFRVDTTTPSTSIEVTPNPDGDNGWYQANPTITLAPDETATTFFSWDTTASFTTYTVPLSLPLEGVHTLHYRSVDAANNIESTQEQSFKYDFSPPSDPKNIISSSHQVGKWSNDNSVDIELSGATDTASGVAAYSISWSKDTTEVPSKTIDIFTNGSTTETTTSKPCPEGDSYANVRTRDNAGNWTSTAHMGPFKIDITGPSGSLKISNGAAYTKTKSVTLDLSAIDTGGSGLVSMRFKNYSGGAWSGWMPYATTKSWNLTYANGKKRVYVQLKDGAGTINPVIISDTIKYDSKAPSGSIKINGGATYTKSRNVTLNIYGSDSGVSGLALMRFKNSDGGGWSGWYPYATSKSWKLTYANGTKRVYSQIKDGAGNVNTTIISNTIKYDSKAPWVNLYTPSVSSTRRFKVRWPGGDSLSGIQNYTVRYKRSDALAWRTWRVTRSTYGYFYGVKGKTYSFRVLAKDRAGNAKWSSIKSTTVSN